ncbi:MAG: hypothetical protein QM733_21250 [Ilumatobacteraceae bacterium]
MRLAGPGRADETHVVGASDPGKRNQVVVAGAADGGPGEVELVEGLVDGEPGGGHPGAPVRFVAGDDLEINEDPQGLFWRPALCLRGEQDVGALAADC